MGIYDPLGRAILFLVNDGSRVSISRGPAAEAFDPEGRLPVPPEGIRVAAGPLSLGKILSGDPGCAVGGGDLGRTPDGAWVYSDGRQRLFTDPTKRHLSRAEYEFSGKRFRVSYPEREPDGPAGLVRIDFPGGRISLRRDVE